MELLESILMLLKEWIWGGLTSIEINGTPILLALVLWTIAITITIVNIRNITKRQKR